MKNSLKYNTKSSNEDIGKLKEKIKKLERQILNTDKNQGKNNQEAINEIKLGEERVRMALEEKLKEMWQPAEVLNRIASFVDSGLLVHRL